MRRLISAFRQQVILSAQQHIDRLPVYLDTETTGLNATDEIVEICVLDHAGNVLIDTLIRPQQSIPLYATRVHGITDAMVCDAPSWLDVWPDVVVVLEGYSAGIYNAEFDLRLMHQSHLAAGKAWKKPQTETFCIMRLFASFVHLPGHGGSPRWCSLEEAGRYCSIPLVNAHRAQADALLAREVLHFIARSGS